MFEFGTCTGKTTYAWARNAPAGADVVTLTLAPTQAAAYTVEAGDDARDASRAIEETTHDRFYYTGTDVEGRVTQLFADSKQFDETPYLGRCDLIFIDGSHALSYVLSDSEKALRMCKPGGLILWHDYVGGRVPGVFQALNQLARKLPLINVAGTSLVAYRKPAG
jgi:predicted O-methyltransferase YrrM